MFPSHLCARDRPCFGTPAFVYSLHPCVVILIFVHFYGYLPWQDTSVSIRPCMVKSPIPTAWDDLPEMAISQGPSLQKPQPQLVKKRVSRRRPPSSSFGKI